MPWQVSCGRRFPESVLPDRYAVRSPTVVRVSAECLGRVGYCVADVVS